MTAHSNFSDAIRIGILGFSLMLFGLHLSFGQGIDVGGEITEADILNHFKNKGITYSIEGIWLCKFETTIKAYNKGEQFFNKVTTGDSNFKIAFLNVQDKIQLYSYSEESTRFKPQTGEARASIKSTPNSSIFLYTVPSVVVDGKRFKECNAEIIVKNNLIEYTTTIEPDDIEDVKTIFITKKTGYKIAPTERDLQASGESGSKITFPIKAVGNMHYLSVEIAGESISYLIDSGSSYISITTAMEKRMKDMGVLRDSDYQGEVDLELADNSIKRLKKIIIPVVKIGSQSITNVEAVVSDGSLLLGRSVMNKFKSWNIDNSSNQLVVEKY